MSDSKCTVPIVRDVDKIISGDCKAAQGGDMTVQPPEYVLIVTNPDNPVTNN